MLKKVITKEDINIIEPEETKPKPKAKGEFNGLCNRTSCQSPNEVTWYNHSTRLYYCTDCAMLLNRVNPEAQLLFGHALCTNELRNHLNS